jgi:glycosyltransferase involved in cell wall biosynthesis
MFLFSIITPVYNNIEYIEECIKNVISQGDINLEHLIIDGGSSDGTVQVIEKYALKHPHIRWLSEKDNGQSDAMNKGIKLAKGEYISFLNVDDFYSEGTLSQVSTIISSTNLSFIVGDCNVLNESGELIYINKPNKLKSQHILAGYPFPVNPSAYFYKKELHDIVGPYNVKNHYNMDLEFLIEISFIEKMSYFSENWGNFRVLPLAKTGSDQQNGNLEKRKKELFNNYLKNSSFKLKAVTFSSRFVRIGNKKLQILKKGFLLPFEMIYWKIRKLLIKK